MLKPEIKSLKAGDRLFVRNVDPHFHTTTVLDVDVLSYAPGTGAEIAIHHNGQVERSILYESGRTPFRHKFLVTDFFRELPSRDAIGHYEYTPYRSKPRGVNQ